MRSSTLVALVVTVALLSGGVAVRVVGAESAMDDRGFRGHDRPDDVEPDDDATDGRELLDGQHNGMDGVPDDVRRYDFQPNQHRHPTMLDDGRRHERRRVDPLPPSQQPPPMQPYWGTMQPYWKPANPNGSKRSEGPHRRH